MAFGGFANTSAATKPLTGGAFSFGNAGTGAAAATVNPFSYSQAPAASASTAASSLFSTPSTAAAPLGGSLFNTGATAPAASSAGSLFPNLGTSAATTGTTASSGFAFKPLGTATTAAASTGGGLLLNSAASTAASTSSLTGGGLFQTSTASGLFSTPKTSAPAAGGGLFSGLSATTTSSGGSLFGGGTSTGLFGAKPLGAGLTTTSSLLGGGLTAAQPASTAVQFKGLGGTDSVKTTSSTGNATSTSSDPKLAKESNVPPELLQHVEALKKHIAEEKAFRDKISRNSTVKPLFQTQSEISAIRNETVVVFSIVQKSLNYANNIKEEFKQELRNYEMISRVRDTPVALQDPSYNPIAYFLNKANYFSNHMLQLADQLHTVEKFLMQHQDAITADQLVLGLHQINETFVALVARYQEIQAKVNQLKSEYLKYRKSMHHDNTDVFEQLHKQSNSLNMNILSPSKYTDAKSLEKHHGSANSSYTCTVGPTSFTSSTVDTESAIKGPASGIASNSLFSGGSFGSPMTGSGSTGLFGQSSFGTSPFGSTVLATSGSPSNRPGTKRNKSK